MIYLADDYMNKYEDTLGYIIARARHDKYSLDMIQRTLAYSQMLMEVEKSNVTLIAFTPKNELYEGLFSAKNSKSFSYNEYGIFSWVGMIYWRLFLDYQITFESLFLVVPIDFLLSKYPTYHEMDYLQLREDLYPRFAVTRLDVAQVEKHVSTKRLSELTGLSAHTLSALRYGRRDINKLESAKLLKIANALNVRMESLFNKIDLITD